MTAAAGTYLASVIQDARLTESDKRLFESHRASVAGKLKKSFDATRVEVIGSQARNSTSRYGGDLDLFLKLANNEAYARGKLRPAATVLRTVRAVLERRYRNTSVQRDRHAVTIAFADGVSVDVVPAVFDPRSSGSYPWFLIPDARGGWMRSSPYQHNTFINAADVASGGKVKNIARLFKRWRWRSRASSTLTSFHLELLLASERTCRVETSYAESILATFGALSRRECAPLRDPVGVAGIVPAASTEPKRQALLKAVRAAYEHAARACDAMDRGKDGEALRQWKLVFRRRST